MYLAFSPQLHSQLASNLLWEPYLERLRLPSRDPILMSLRRVLSPLSAIDFSWESTLLALLWDRKESTLLILLAGYPQERFWVIDILLCYILVCCSSSSRRCILSFRLSSCTVMSCNCILRSLTYFCILFLLDLLIRNLDSLANTKCFKCFWYLLWITPITLTLLYDFTNWE